MALKYHLEMVQQHQSIVIINIYQFVYDSSLLTEPILGFHLFLLLILFFLVPVDLDLFFLVRRCDKSRSSFISGKRGIICLILPVWDAAIRFLCSSAAAAALAVVTVTAVGYGSESYEYPRK